MQAGDFLTNGFKLGEEFDPVKVLGERLPVPKEMVPWISDPKAWDNYVNETYYAADKMLREWMEEMCQDPAWGGFGKKPMYRRRYTFGQLFHILWGRPYDSKRDAKMVRPLQKLFSYYSSKVQMGGTNVQGKKVGSKHPVYCLSPSRLHKMPPYSLKLRMEWLQAQGRIPNGRNMAPPKDDLERNHARNPKTEANLQKRRAEGRRRYDERYKQKQLEKRRLEETGEPRRVSDESRPREADVRDSQEP